MFRLSRRGSKAGQEPELDFRPKSATRKPVNEGDTTSLEVLAKAEINRLSGGGGGAVVSDVEWVPDPINGGQRAVFRPASSRLLQKAAEADEEEKGIPDTVPENVVTETSSVPTSPSQPPPPRRRTKKGEDPMSSMTAEEKAQYAKAVIEEAVEAERSALEQKLTIKKRG